MAAERNPERLLDVENLDVAYDAIQVVWGLSLSVRRGEVVTIIGANGAGKTTTLKAIAGLIPARSGKIEIGRAHV